MRNNAEDFFEDYQARVEVHFKHNLIAYRKNSVQANNHIIATAAETIQIFGVMGYAMRAMAYVGKGDLNNAIANFGYAIQDLPSAAWIYVHRGAVYGEKGDFDDAIADFDTALRLKSDSADGYYFRSIAYLGKGDFKRAFVDCDKAIRLQSMTEYLRLDAYLVRGFLYGKDGNFDEAIADFKSALKIKIDNVGNDGSISIKEDFYSNAKEYLKYAQNENTPEAVKVRYDRLIQKKNNALTEDDYYDIARQFRAMKGYKDTADLALECDNLAIKVRYNQLIKKKNNASTEDEYQELAKQFRAMNGYENTADLALECDNIAKKSQYNRLVQKKNNASTKGEYQDLVNQFKAMNGYEDTSKLANECELLREQRIKEEKQKAKKELIIKTLISLGIVALLVLAVIFLMNNKTAKNEVQKNSANVERAESKQPKPNAIKLNPINITKTEMFYLPIMGSNGFYKFITLEGNNITEAKYLRAYIFQEGRALVQNKDSLWGYIDTKGNTIASGYKQALSFKDGVAWVNDNGTIKSLDLNGRVIKTLSSDIISIWSFYEGFALFSMNGVQTYIDKNYNTISDKYAFFDGNRFQEGLASVSCDNGKYGYIDTQANFIINCAFDEAKTFKNSKAIVRIGENWGAINKQGKYAFGLYSDIEVINHDGELFSYKKKNGGWGWLNSSGQIIIQPIYEEIMTFDDRDIAPVKRNGLWGYIDKNGNYKINAQYAVAYPFFNNRAIVKIGDDFITIDKNGTQDLQTRSQRIDPSYWDIVNTGIVRNPRIMTVEPSIKCSTANLSNAEKMICRSVNLAKLDKETDNLYKSILRNNKSVANSQKEFLAKRNSCSTISCIESVYRVRNNELHN